MRGGSIQWAANQIGGPVVESNPPAPEIHGETPVRRVPEGEKKNKLSNDKVIANSINLDAFVPNFGFGQMTTLYEDVRSKMSDECPSTRKIQNVLTCSRAVVTAKWCRTMYGIHERD